MRHSAWNTMVDVSATRAPKGQLDDVFKAIGPMLGAANFTPEWTSRMQRKIADDSRLAMDQIRKMGEETAARMKANHEAYMNASRASFEKSQAIDREHQEAMHRSAVAWTLYAGDEQLVKNPQTGQISRVTNQYGKNAHQDAVTGTIVISEDPNYDPSYYIRGQWTQLENVDPTRP